MSRFIRDLTFTEQLLIPAYSVGIYLTRTVVPAGLTPVYSAPPLGLLAGTAAAVVVFTVWLTRMRSRAAARNALLAGSVFLLFVLPTMVGIVAKTGIQPWADRYLYAASIPLFLLIGGGTVGLLRRGPGRGNRPALWMASAGLVVALVLSALLVRAYLPVWNTSERLWRSVIAASPELSYGYNNLGAVLMARGETDSALASYRTAQLREPSTPGPWFNMGLAFAELGRSDSAAWYYRNAIRCDSAYVDAYTALGTLALAGGDTAEARRQYEAALICDRTSAKAHYNIGILCYQRGDARQAQQHFEQALVSEPFSIRVLLSLGVVHSERGDHEKARTFFRDAARLGSPEARQVLAAEHEPW